MDERFKKTEIFVLPV